MNLLHQGLIIAERRLGQQRLINPVQAKTLWQYRRQNRVAQMDMVVLVFCAKRIHIRKESGQSIFPKWGCKIDSEAEWLPLLPLGHIALMQERGEVIGKRCIAWCARQIDAVIPEDEEGCLRRGWIIDI